MNCIKYILLCKSSSQYNNLRNSRVYSIPFIAEKKSCPNMSQFVYPLSPDGHLGCFQFEAAFLSAPTGPDVKLPVEGSEGQQDVPPSSQVLSFLPSSSRDALLTHTTPTGTLEFLCYSQPLKFPGNCCGLTAGFPRCVQQHSLVS